MRPLTRAYLVLGLATLVGSAIMAAHVVITAPASGYQVLVMTNMLGEGPFEAVLLAAMLPAWVMLFRRIVAVV